MRIVMKLSSFSKRWTFLSYQWNFPWTLKTEKLEWIFYLFLCSLKKLHKVALFYTNFTGTLLLRDCGRDYIAIFINIWGTGHEQWKLKSNFWTPCFSFSDFDVRCLWIWLSRTPPPHFLQGSMVTCTNFYPKEIFFFFEDVATKFWSQPLDYSLTTLSKFCWNLGWRGIVIKNYLHNTIPEECLAANITIM